MVDLIHALGALPHDRFGFLMSIVAFTIVQPVLWIVAWRDQNPGS
ncbi:hypothetical protein [Gluconacetobacter entanii]|nr:hypothetical protein [Gluconacetobacter entanii]